MPRIASILLLRENQAESLGHQRQTYTLAAKSGGHGGAAHPRSHLGYGSLTESVEPEPASESVDDPHDVVSHSSASPSSYAAAALAAARTLSAALRNGRTTRPIQKSPSSACRHHISATISRRSDNSVQVMPVLLRHNTHATCRWKVRGVIIPKAGSSKSLKN